MPWLRISAATTSSTVAQKVGESETAKYKIPATVATQHRLWLLSDTPGAVARFVIGHLIADVRAAVERKSSVFAVPGCAGLAKVLVVWSGVADTLALN
jgi:hypothetical protein